MSVSDLSEQYAATEPDVQVENLPDEAVVAELPLVVVQELDDTPNEEIPPLLKRHQIARLMGLTLSTTKKITGVLIKSKPEAVVVDDKGSIFLRREFLPYIAENSPPPKGWTNDEGLVSETGATARQVRRARQEIRDQFEDEAYAMRRAENETVPSEHFNAEVAARVREIVQERKRQSGGANEKRTQEEEVFDDWAEDMKDRETLESIEYEKILDLFGDENAVDVTVQYLKDANLKVSMPRVKSFLAEYLGDFVVKKGKLDLDNINYSLPLLQNRNLQLALTEVIKRHCLKSYHNAIRDDANQDDFDLIAEYIDEIKDRLDGLDSEKLDEVLDAVEDYYLSLFEIEVPEAIVGSLYEGRPFPDLNQRINIKETLDKKRMLIGDDPGMGKSASAILSKEISGAKCAVIITPKTVIGENVWQTYLSDSVDEAGQQVGYFKPGMAPRVLVVDRLGDLYNVNQQDYDYVIISHEKINADYTNALKRIDFDMLIIDEAHKFKNTVDGKRSQHMIELSDTLKGPNDLLMLLTGTPAPNKVFDIAFSLRLLYPDRFKQYTNKDLIYKIVNGDVLDIRSLLLPKMQNKKLSDSLEMPPLTEETIMVKLSPAEQEVYEIILDEWEMDATEKIRFLRQILLNPAILDATPDIVCTKANEVGARIAKAFETKRKVLMFTNEYVDGVISGDRNIIEALNIPADVKTYIIYGDVLEPIRRQIRHEFKYSKDKILLIQSGGTADVGIDLSAAEKLLFYNEPWTETEKRQQLGRAWRPGRSGELTADTFIIEGTIEEGTHRYIWVKYQAIEKLLYGVPLTEIEKELLVGQKEADVESLAVNPELAAYYFSSMHRMNMIFGLVKEVGEAKFGQILDNLGKEYASTYKDLTDRSYQANAARLSATVIDRFSEERHDFDKTEPVILDLGSGPEMLKRHMPDRFAHRVVSFDMNRAHFDEASGPVANAQYSHIPVTDKAADFVNMGLSLHYTEWLPSKGHVERLGALQELNRVLKTGGKAVITMTYSLDLSDEKKFQEVIGKLGFKLVEDYSGPVQYEQNYKGRIITLEKIDDCTNDIEGLFSELTDDDYRGLRFKSKDVTIRDPRKFATEYTIKDKRVVVAKLNQQDKRVLKEERTILDGMKTLRRGYGGIEQIPAEDLITLGYSRIFNGHSYVLFKKLTTASGAVVLRNSDH